MNISSHSPLPWTLERYGCIKAGTFRDYTNGKSQDQIVMVCEPGEDNGTKDANAELIVRAVNSHAELLAALESIVAIIDSGEGINTIRRGRSLNAGRAAIAKAKGQP